MSKTDDLSVDGPGSPYSMKKVVNHITDGELTPLNRMTILIENQGLGFHNDDPNMITIDCHTCQEQSLYYLENHFDGENIPAYLFRYLEIAYGDYIGKEETFKTNQEYANAINSGKLDKNSDRYKAVLNRIKYLDKNPEAQQVIGLIQSMSGIMSMCNKAGKFVRIFIKEPETHMHPKRQASIVSVFEQIRSDYEYKQENKEDNEHEHRTSEED